jgi:hypothetical protein
MSNLVFALCLVTAVSGGQRTGEDRWTTNYAQALRAARENHKPLLVVIENPADAQQRVDAAQLESDPARKALLERYQLCRVDATTPYGQKVAKAFGADDLPFTAVSDDDTQVLLFQKAGEMSRQDWAQALRTRTATTTAVQAAAAPQILQGAPVFYDSGSAVPFGSTYFPSSCPSCNMGGSSGWYVPYSR